MLKEPYANTLRNFTAGQIADIVNLKCDLELDDEARLKLGAIVYDILCENEWKPEDKDGERWVIDD